MLTVKQIKAAEPKEEPYRLLGGNDLYLYVPVSRKKIWQLHYKIDGEEKISTVGEYPLMTLQETRDEVWTTRKDISVNIDPVKAEEASSNNNSFSAIYEEWYEYRKQVWSVGCATGLARMFDDDILPIINGLEIQDIEPMQLLEVVRRFEDRGAMEQANRVRGRYGKVFRYTIITNGAKYNPTPDFADTMGGYRKKNFPLLPADQTPAFNKTLAAFSGSVVSLITTKILRYAALRAKELRSVLWKNVDLENRIITIDASVIEGREIHVVLMSDQVVELLTTLGSITEPVSEFVFTGRNDKKEPIYENTVLFVIKQIGYEDLESGHGFRYKFGTITNEHEWPASAIEVQLAHANGGSVRDIYDHAQYLDKRGEMMQWWTDWPDEKVEWSALTTTEEHKTLCVS